MQIDRRSFMKASVAGTAAVLLPFNQSKASGSVANIGGASLSVVSDGNLVLPGNFMVPPDFPADQLEALLTENALSLESYEPACNVSLWQSEDHLVLFDAGAGPNFMPSAGKLLESLESLEIDLADITDVVFTHAHPDHIWGLVDDFDELAFPDANFHMCGIEWDYWQDSNTLDSLPETRKVFAVGAKARMEYISDRVKLFNYGDELLPGVEAVDSAGHTPGHTSFVLHQGSDSIMVLGDAITHPVISFQKYDWPSGGDQDPTKAQLSRKKLLDRMAQEKMQILGFHLPHPGLGRVEKQGLAYRYVPV